MWDVVSNRTARFPGCGRHGDAERGGAPCESHGGERIERAVRPLEGLFGNCGARAERDPRTGLPADPERLGACRRAVVDACVDALEYREPVLSGVRTRGRKG